MSHFLSDSDDSIDYDALVKRAETVAPAPPKPAVKPRIFVKIDLQDEKTIRVNHFPDFEPIARKHNGSRVFNSDGAFWDLPITQFRPVIAALHNPALPFTASIDTFPDSVFKGVMGLKPRPASPNDLNTIPPKLLGAMFPHQRESVLFALSRGFRVLIADDMGLGKTVEAIACSCVAGFPGTIKVLVLAPNNLVNGWVEAYMKWTNVWQSSINVVLKQEKLANTPLTVVSFTAGTRMAAALSEFKFDMVIVDESHELKNQTTQTYKALSPVIGRSKYLLMLSGTPTKNRPAELFPQLKLLMPRVFWSFHEYAVRYCKGGLNQYGKFECGGISHSHELKVVLEYLVMIRRQKEDVLKDLPAKKRFHTMLDYRPSAAMADMMKTIRVQKISISAGMGSLKTEQSIVVGRAFAATAKEKLPVVLSWLCSAEFRNVFLKENRKCLIFGHHVNMLEGIHEWLTQQEVDSILITGSTSRDQRERQLLKFHSDPDCKVAVLSIEIASTGLTLTEASLVVFAELKWTPAEHQQAEDRVHRIGQTRDVVIHYLHAPGSLDDRMWDMLEQKLVTIGSVITSNTTTFETDTNAT